MSRDYRQGFEDAMNDNRRQVEPEDFFDRPDYVAGFAAARAAGWPPRGDAARARRRVEAWQRAPLDPDDDSAA